MTFTWNEIPVRTTEQVGSSRISVFVVSTLPELLSSSVAAASRLSQGLEAQIEVLAPHVVPYPLDLSHPPIQMSFLVNKLLPEEVLLSEVQTARILLCRDEEEAVLAALAPKSIVVMAAKKRWWKTREDCLSDALRKAGHQIVIAWA